MKNCSKYHGPILPVDPPPSEDEPSASQSSEMSDFSELGSTQQSMDPLTPSEPQPGPSKDLTDVDMAGEMLTLQMI